MYYEGCRMKKYLEGTPSKLSCVHRAFPHVLALHSSWKLPCKDPTKEELLNWLCPGLGQEEGQRQHPSIADFVPPWAEPLSICSCMVALPEQELSLLPSFGCCLTWPGTAKRRFGPLQRASIAAGGQVPGLGCQELPVAAYAPRSPSLAALPACCRYFSCMCRNTVRVPVAELHFSRASSHLPCCWSRTNPSPTALVMSGSLLAVQPVLRHLRQCLRPYLGAERWWDVPQGFKMMLGAEETIFQQSSDPGASVFMQRTGCGPCRVPAQGHLPWPWWDLMPSPSLPLAASSPSVKL